jgi:hypothetical protein
MQVNKRVFRIAGLTACVILVGATLVSGQGALSTVGRSLSLNNRAAGLVVH